jgi:hypothetical protein
MRGEIKLSVVDSRGGPLLHAFCGRLTLAGRVLNGNVASRYVKAVRVMADCFAVRAEGVAGGVVDGDLVEDLRER